MRAAFFGTYNRRHTANRIASCAVRAAGYEIVEFHDALWERTRDKDAAYFSPRSLIVLARQWLASAWRLSRAWWRSGGAPVAIVGFNGQLDILLLKMLAPRYGPRIVFAPLVSLTETLVEDRRVYAEGTFGARILRMLDRLTCRAADVVVVDTEAHRRYFVDELGVDPSRLLVCHLGADPEVFLAASEADADESPKGASKTRNGAGEDGGDGRLEVLYFGQYLPLHGLDVVVDAVGRLAVRDDVRERLRFTFLGTGEERARIERSVRATRAVVRFIDWIPYEDLAGRIAAADIVLGIFGSSQKARMVVPNKVYEAAAVGSAIVTADTPAIREVFEDGKEIVLCAADGLALANAIATLSAGPAGDALRERLGSAARARMLEGFTAEKLGRCWSVALEGPHALRADENTALPEVGVAVLCFQDARRTLECLHSLAGDGYPASVLVVDNGSTPDVRRELAAGIEKLSPMITVDTMLLDCNLGYAGANNLAMKLLFERGCEHVLVLNSDTVVARGTIEALVRAARLDRRAGPLGPRISDGRPGQPASSLGERYRPALLWAPRSLVRVRGHRQRPYPVSGVTGAAMLVPRALYERIGGFDESLFAYYEEVDFCLRAAAAGFAPTVVPEAEVGHAGARGFAGGMTPLAAFLKARNLRLVGLRRAQGFSRAVFLAGYHVLVAVSAAVYRMRGRRDVASAMLEGLRAAARDESGAPPESLFFESGYATSGGAGRSLQEIAGDPHA
ncbi:MAG TPA: glycosyltransferase [Candidatus Limnocylindrales bacterium]|nr:glycosyltransferase [Candidatus Limnocylindrales bacterium]